MKCKICPRVSGENCCRVCGYRFDGTRKEEEE